eukprot:Rmarinus@m.20123
MAKVLPTIRHTCLTSLVDLPDENVLTFVTSYLWALVCECNQRHPFHNGDMFKRWLNRMLLSTNAPTMLYGLILVEKFRLKFSTLGIAEQKSLRMAISTVPRLYFISVLVAQKMTMDVCYSNLVWVEISEKLYSLEEINAMELDLIKFLSWNVHVDADEFDSFVDAASYYYYSQETFHASSISALYFGGLQDAGWIDECRLYDEELL